MAKEMQRIKDKQIKKPSLPQQPQRTKQQKTNEIRYKSKPFKMNICISDCQSELTNDNKWNYQSN